MIRPLIPDDFELFYQIRLYALQSDPQAFVSMAEEWVQRPRPETEKRFRTSTTNADEFILGAFLNDEIVGMVGFQRYQSRKIQHKGFLWGMFIAPEARGRGLGGELFDFALRMAGGYVPDGLRVLTLSVITTQTVAYRLYESRGFVTYGVEKAAVQTDNGQLYDEAHLQRML